MEIGNFKGPEHLTACCDTCFGVELIMFILPVGQKVAVNWEEGRYGWSLLLSLQKGFPHGFEHYKVDQLLRASFFTEFIKFKPVTVWTQKQFRFCAIISVKFPSCPGQSSVMCKALQMHISVCIFVFLFKVFLFLKRVFPSRYENLVKEWKINLPVELKCFLFSVTLLIMAGWMFSIESAGFIYSRGLLNTKS